VILNVVPGLQFIGAAEVTGLLPLALMVGFVEESVFRGLMLTALRERGVWRAIIVTSVLFGLTHLANVLAGATVLETISQVAYTIAFGVAFAALVLSTGIIGPWYSRTQPSMRPMSSRCPALRSPRPGR
jgi:membrane protease YdiL (CAAX protease family)